MVAVTALGVVAGGTTMAIAEVTTPNTTSLAAVGPTSGVHGFPVWYEDDKELRLEQCLDVAEALCDPAFLVDEGLDPNAPLHIGDAAAESNFPGESFYYQALNVYDLSNGGSVDFTSALEATFANEAAVDGDQVVFGRIRIRVDGLTPGETYTVTHPYGVDTFEADAEGEINFTEDKTPAPGNFGLALGSRVAPFLVDADGLHETATGTYIGDPAEETAVTGSAFGTNHVSVTGPGLAAGGERNDLFTLLGKVSTNSGIEGVAAYRIDAAEGQDYVDVYATAGENDSVQVSGGSVPLTTLAGTGTTYYARIPVAADTFPESVTVVNASDQPAAEKVVPVTDNVVVTGATYLDGTLTVTAQSSDSSTTLAGSVGGTALSFTGGTATLTGLAAPPATITVTSSAGGTDTAPILVQGATAGTLVPQTAVVAGVSSAAQGQTVTLDGGSSTNATAFSWTQTAGTPVIDGPTAGPTLTFTTPAAAGALTFELSTTGPEGTKTATHTVEVLDAAVEPTVDAVASTETPEVGAQVTLTATATNAASYAWAQDSGPTIGGLDLSGPSLTFAAPNAPVVFTVTVTSPSGTTVRDTVTVTPNTDVLRMTAAELRTGKNEWRVAGTSTVTALNTVSVYLQRADGSKGALVGSVTVDATGAWDIRNRGLAPGGATRLLVESTKGGLLTGVTFTSRR
ncbi:hypothetical protein ACI79D_15690 [Geodermatophilus sp. SYSU D00708]